MFAILPLAAFGLINLILRHFQRNEDGRRIFLLSAVIWGTLVVLNTEIFSLFQGLNFRCVLGFWTTVVGLGFILLTFKCAINSHLGNPYFLMPICFGAEGLITNRKKFG